MQPCSAYAAVDRDACSSLVSICFFFFMSLLWTAHVTMWCTPARHQQTGPCFASSLISTSGSDVHSKVSAELQHHDNGCCIRTMGAAIMLLHPTSLLPTSSVLLSADCNDDCKHAHLYDGPSDGRLQTETADGFMLFLCNSLLLTHNVLHAKE